MKKVLLTLTAVILLLGSLSPSALSAEGGENAGTFSDVDKTRYGQAWPAIEFMTKHHIMNGFPDGTFRPDVPVTRAELSVIFYKLFDRYRLGEFKKLPDDKLYRIFFNRLTYRSIKDFSDMNPNHWAYEEIAALYPLFWFGPLREYDVYGKPAFKPDKKLKREELAYIIKRAFEYDFNQWAPASGKVAQFLSGNLKDIPVYAERSYEDGFRTLDKLRKEGKRRFIIIVYLKEQVGFLENGTANLSETLYQLHHNQIMTLDARGRFRPDEWVTRSEVAQILYGLVRYLYQIGTLPNYSSLDTGDLFRPGSEQGSSGSPGSTAAYDALDENGTVRKDLKNEGEIIARVNTQGYSTITINVISEAGVDLYVEFNGQKGFLRKEELPVTLPLDGIEQMVISTQLRSGPPLKDYTAQLSVQLNN